MNYLSLISFSVSGLASVTAFQIWLYRFAYQQGYDQGYLPQLAPLPGIGGYNQQPSWQQPTPQTQVPTYPGGSGYTPPPTNDPVYQQGYDYGLRDRVGGRPNDPGAHTGRYDPRNRRSFECGYVDAYNSR
jgi:hypothetical protein